MTLPLRRKRPITRPNSNRPRAISRLAALGAALIVAVAAIANARADLQWNRPSPTTGQSATDASAGAATTRESVRLAGFNDAATDSPATREPDVRLAAQFDPFESAPADGTTGGALGSQPADPFDPDDAFGGIEQQPEPADEPTDDSPEPGFDPFEETPAPGGEPTTPDEELGAAEEAVEEELGRRDAAEGMQDELPAGEDNVQRETAPGVERELPSFDSSEFDSNLDEIPYDWRDDDAGPDVQAPEQSEQRRQQLAREREQAAKDCEEIQKIARGLKLSDISLDISLRGDPGQDYPFECALGDDLFTGRNWSQVTYRWKAAGLCHKPLYFEQVQLERYGHSWGPFVQPIVSGAHFFATLPILPYKMGLQTPNECIYTLGYYRPGSCAPYLIHALPFTWRAAAFQGFVVTGTAFVIP